MILFRIEAVPLDEAMVMFIDYITLNTSNLPTTNFFFNLLRSLPGRINQEGIVIVA